MVLPGPITDYAMIENAFVYDLYAVSICMIAKWNPNHVEPSDNQCVFSYAVPGSDNELTLWSYPTFRVLIHGERRYSQLCGNLLSRSRIVSQWSSTM